MYIIGLVYVGLHGHLIKKGLRPFCHQIFQIRKEKQWTGTRGGRILFMLVQGDPESYANKSSKSRFVILLTSITTLRTPITIFIIESKEGSGVETEG